MLTLRKKLIVIMCVLFGFLGSIGMKTMADKQESGSELPIKKLVIKVGKEQREKFFSQLKGFSEKHGFAIRIAPTTPTGEDFSIQMWRGDFKLFGANPFDSTVFQLGVYETDSVAKEIPSSYLDSLIGDLEVFVNKVPNSTFSEKE